MVRVTIRDNQSAIAIQNATELASVFCKASEEACNGKILAGITLESELSTRLVIVVGGPETVLTFESAHGRPPYYVSKGSLPCDEPVFACYLNFAHHSEFARKCVIQMVDGIRAANEFFRSGELPRCVDWDEV